MKSHANSRKDRRRLVIWHPTERVAYHYSSRYLQRNSFSKVQYLLMGFSYFQKASTTFLIEMQVFEATTNTFHCYYCCHNTNFFVKSLFVFLLKENKAFDCQKGSESQYVFFFYKRQFFLQVALGQTIIPKSILHFGMNKKKPFYVNPIKNVTQLSYNFGFT